MVQAKTLRRGSLLAILIILASLAVYLPVAQAAPTLIAGSPQVAVSPRVGSSGVVAGHEFGVDVNVTANGADISKLRAVTAELSYDPTMLEFVRVAAGSLLDDPAASISPAVASGLPAGQLSITVTRGGTTAGPYLGSSAAFTVVFKAKKAGTASITLSRASGTSTNSGTAADVIIDSSTAQSVYETPALVNGSVSIVSGSVTGTVNLQGRGVASGNAEVQLFLGSTMMPHVVATALTDSSGNFTLPNVPAGRYNVLAKPVMSGTAKATPHTTRFSMDVAVSGISAANVGSLMLQAGDINGDEMVNANDLNEMAAVWRTASTGLADLDGDGKVYGVDLALLARNWQYSSAMDVSYTPPTAFQQGLNKRILVASGGAATGDALTDAQVAVQVLRGSRSSLDAAKMTIVSTVVNALRRHAGTFGVLLDSNVTLAGLTNNSSVAAAIADARTQFNTVSATLEAADFRDLDNELAVLESKGASDPLLIADEAYAFKGLMSAQVSQDLFLAAYIWVNRNVSGFETQVCGYAGESAGCDLSNLTTWTAVKNGLNSSITSAQWWTTLQHGIDKTYQKTTP